MEVILIINPKDWADEYIVNAVAETINKDNLEDLRNTVSERLTQKQVKQKEYFD